MPINVTNGYSYQHGIYGHDPASILIKQSELRGRHEAPVTTAPLIERKIHDLLRDRGEQCERQKRDHPQNPVKGTLARWYSVSDDLADFEDFYSEVGPRPADFYCLATFDRKKGITKGNLIWRPESQSTDYVNDHKATLYPIHSEIQKSFGGSTGAYVDRPKGDYHCILAQPELPPLYLGSCARKKDGIELIYIAIQIALAEPSITLAQLRSTARDMSGHHPGKPIGNTMANRAIKISDYCGAVTNRDNTITLYHPPKFTEWAIPTPN